MLKNKILIITTLLFAFAGCSQHPKMTDRYIYDPSEPWNREVFAFNVALDDYVLSPVAYGYKEAAPGLLKLLIRNQLDYLQTPISLINAVLQGDGQAIGHISSRFFINTTLGGLGFLNPATEFGFAAHSEDFGQTMAVWGIADGGYYMTPFLGPMSVRDLFGRIGTIAINPMTYIDDVEFYLSAGMRMTNIIDFRAQNYDNIDNLKKSTDDYYNAVKSIYLQSRIAEIENKDLNPSQDYIDFEDE